MYDEPTIDEVLLHEDNFPPHFRNHAHPDDYLAMNHAIVPEKIAHFKRNRNRLILRVSWRLGVDSFATTSFICDTGCPGYLYLSPEALKVLEGRIQTNDLQQSTVALDGRLAEVEETPRRYGPCNIIGLQLLLRWGLRLTPQGFDFDNLPNVW
jgi:hypothetical protein